MTIEEKLSKLRKEKGLSQLEVSEELGVSRQAISRWEVGDAVPSTDNLKSLSKLYKVSVDYLLDSSKDEWEGPPPDKQSATSDKKTKRCSKQVTVAIWFLLLMTVILICITVVHRENAKITPIEEMQVEEDVSAPAEFFSIDW